MIYLKNIFCSQNLLFITLIFELNLLMETKSLTPETPDDSAPPLFGAPSSSPPPEEFNIQSFDLDFNGIQFIFSLYDLPIKKIKLLSKFKDTSKKEYKKYEVELGLEEMKKNFRYFRIFEDYNEFKEEFLKFCKEKSYEIKSYDANEIKLVIKTKLEELIEVILKKVNLSTDEQIDFVINDIDDRNEKIYSLTNEMKEIKDDIKKKDIQITNLEKNINELKDKINDVENIKQINEELKGKISNIEDSIKEIKKLMEKDERKRILYDSRIFKNKNEIEFLYKSISPNDNLTLKLLFNSKVSGEDKEKLKSAYRNKSDIIILVKTKTNKRFGGYAHEPFIDSKDFHVRDNKAFLFSLDKSRIYKSKGTENTLWNYNDESIDFGWGVDLRIFHKFFSKRNYTNPSDKEFDYKGDKFALNGEKYFDISRLEIYQVVFNGKIIN